MSLLPFDDRDGIVWLDGSLISWRDANLTVLNLGLQQGSSVFEGERIYGGRVFQLSRHSKRLLQSAELLGFEISYSADQLDGATRSVVAANHLQEGYVRPTAWCGGTVGSRTCVAIAGWNSPSLYSPSHRTQGLGS